MNSHGEEHNNNTRRVSRGGSIYKTQVFLAQDHCEEAIENQERFSTLFSLFYSGKGLNSIFP